MKRLRIWLLILLCALLPLRGAMSAAMLCGPAGDGAASVAMLAAAPADGAQDHAGHGSPHGHPPALASADRADHDHADPASAQDRCTLCAAFCSLTPVPLGHAIVVAPADAAAAPTPDLCAQPPSFVSGGLERPPRSI